MATEQEASFPIEDFGGVNQNLDREKINAIELWRAQNLWEPTVGVMESRRGSQNFVNPAHLPSNITRLDNPMRLYRDGGDHVRMIPAKTTPLVHHETSGTLPAGVSVSLVDDANGFWRKTHIYSLSETGTFSGRPEKIILRFVGYGLDAYYEVDFDTIPGFAASPTTAQKLRVEITSSLDGLLSPGSVVTGFEILSVVKSGSSTTPPITATFSGGTRTSDGTYHTHTMWTAFQELVTAKTGAWDFLYCPVGFMASTTHIGQIKRSFTYSLHSTGGSLKGGKTYYVLVMPQNFWPTSGEVGYLNRRCRYQSPDVDVFGADLIPVRIPPGGSTWRIQLDTISPSTICHVVAIGEHWQSLVPYKIYNDSTSGPISIDYYPRYSPSAVEMLTATDFTQTLYRLTYSPISVNDMNIGVEDNGSIYPIFNSRVHEISLGSRQGANYFDDNFYRFAGENSFDDGFIQRLIADPTLMPRHGVKNTDFTQWENALFSVSDDAPLLVDGTPPWLPLQTNSNLMMTDGNIKVQAFVVGVQPGISACITAFDSSIVLGGAGPLEQRGAQEGIFNEYNIVFSQALDPFDYRIPSTSVLQTVALDFDHERIVGFGLYTNTAMDLGPQSQFLIYKKNSLWYLDRLPGVTGTSLDPAQLGQLSGKVGSQSKYAITNTPLGAILAAPDNVYMIRGEGEPAPIGQEISPILRRSDTSRLFSCYHDRQLKLSFFDPTEAGPSDRNNVEYWLDINKMIEMQGLSTWYGPMLGRNVDYCFVEDKDGDGVISNVARDRVSVSALGILIFKSDVIGVGTDFGNPIEVVLETKDFPVSPQDNNWMKHLKRFYWKIRCVGPFNATDQTWIDGVLKQSQVVSFVGDGVSSFDNQPLKLFRYFPDGRQFGRTIRKKLTTTGRIGIGGYQINYQLIKRRL